VPDTISLAYLTGTLDNVQRNFFTSTPVNMLDYLTAHTALAGSSLTTLFGALEAAGLTEALAGETPFTLFAPKNSALAALPAETLEALLNDPAALARVLQYHIVPEYLPPYVLDGEQTWTTLSGATLTTVFTPGESLTVNGLKVGLQHRVSNGIIYLLDEVMLPPQE
jgi:uncharacterized surface protein with fasciclin (FAS1) repeats